ncbi:MAG: hypothetical protein HY270_12015 [Deltaproteobacteria bacterium]|nr:hypothetical protein [Deltaproteobacteria bacterium]
MASSSDEIPVKEPDGKTVAVILLCNDCQNPSDKKECFEGADVGFHKGKDCGQCLIKANPKRSIDYSYDLHITGTLVNDKGEPIKDRFVKLMLPNGWGHRTKTLDKGQFHLMIGATIERKGKEPLTIDIGKHVDQQKGEKDQYFAMFMLPKNYVGCSDAAPAAPAAAPNP